ncbi:MAG TPA: hypothetical protein V6C96_02730, partial [Vampirovibrionales bacterium]
MAIPSYKTIELNSQPSSIHEKVLSDKSSDLKLKKKVFETTSEKAKEAKPNKKKEDSFRKSITKFLLLTGIPVMALLTELQLAAIGINGKEDKHTSAIVHLL